MSRTLSRGKIGPDPNPFGARPFLYLHPDAATSACFPDARLCSLISAHGALALGNPLLRLGLSRRSTVLPRGWRLAALAKKETGIRPNGLGLTAIREGWRYLKASRALPSSPTNVVAFIMREPLP